MPRACVRGQSPSQGSGQMTSGWWDCLWINAGMFLLIYTCMNVRSLVGSSRLKVSKKMHLQLKPGHTYVASTSAWCQTINDVCITVKIYSRYYCTRRLQANPGCWEWNPWWRDKNSWTPVYSCFQYSISLQRLVCATLVYLWSRRRCYRHTFVRRSYLECQASNSIDVSGLPRFSLGWSSISIPVCIPLFLCGQDHK